MTRQPTTGFQVADGWGTRTGVWAGYVSTTPFGVRSVWSLVKPELLLRAQGQPLKPQNRLFSLNRDVQTGITNHHRLVGILLDTYDRKLALASAAHIIKLKQKAYITNNGRRPVSLALGKVGQFCFTRCRHLAKQTYVKVSLPLSTTQGPGETKRTSTQACFLYYTHERNSTSGPGQPPQHCSQCFSGVSFSASNWSCTWRGEIAKENLFKKVHISISQIAHC